MMSSETDAAVLASPSKSPPPSRPLSQERYDDEKVHATPNRADLYRLHWTLDGPLETAISVMAAPYHDPAEPESAHEPYARAAPDGSTSWHPISEESIENPPTRSVTASIAEYIDLDEAWFVVHEGHSIEGEGPNWGPLPAMDSPADFVPDEEPHLLRCCGEERPWDMEEIKLKLHASSEFLTIHDFVSQVHPWLMGMRDELVYAATYVHGENGFPLPPDTRFMVIPTPGWVRVLPYDKWVAYHGESAVLYSIVPYPRPLAYRMWSDPADL